MLDFISVIDIYIIGIFCLWCLCVYKMMKIRHKRRERKHKEYLEDYSNIREIWKNCPTVGMGTVFYKDGTTRVEWRHDEIEKIKRYVMKEYEKNKGDNNVDM